MAGKQAPNEVSWKGFEDALHNGHGQSQILLCLGVQRLTKTLDPTMTLFNPSSAGLNLGKKWIYYMLSRPGVLPGNP